MIKTCLPPADPIITGASWRPRSNPLVSLSSHPSFNSSVPIASHYPYSNVRRAGFHTTALHLKLPARRHRRRVRKAVGEYLRSWLRRHLQAASTFRLDRPPRCLRVAQAVGQPEQEPPAQHLPAVLVHRTVQEIAGTFGYGDTVAPKWGGHRSGAKRWKKFLVVPLHVFGSKSTFRRFGERFHDGQYSLVCFLFAVRLLTVPPVPSHL